MPPFLIIKNRARAPFSCRGGGMVGTHTASQPASRFSDYSQPQTFRRKTEQSLPSSYFFFVGNHPSFHRRSITDCTTLLFILASSNSFPSNSLAPSIRKRIFSPRRGTQFLSSSSYSSSFLYTHTHKLVLLSLSALNLLISNVSVRMMKFLSEHITLSIFSSKVSSSESLKK